METKSNTKRYWSAVISRAWTEASLGARVIVVGLSAFGAMLVLGIQAFLDDWLFSAVTAVIYFLLLLILTIKDTPSKMHDELGGFIEYPFVVTPIPPIEKSADEQRTASLLVENLSLRPINNCHFTLDEISVDGEPYKKEAGVRFLQWSGRSSPDGNRQSNPVILIKDAPQIIDVATSIPRHPKIRLNLWSGDVTLPPGRFELKITPHGMWKEDITFGKQQMFVLEYQGGNQLAISANGEPPIFPMPQPIIPDVNNKWTT